MTTVLVLLAVDQYFFCPQFDFPGAQPFSGQHLYNPYAAADSFSWRKCNFHAHDKTWLGLTNGAGEAADIWHAYDSLGYDVHCISNYERISHYGKDSLNFIPVYEHGYGIMKNHQLVLGANNVCWKDYLFPQTLSNKQYILNLLHNNDSVVISVNHPCERNAFPPNNFKYLRNYNCLEVLSGTCRSLPQWDSALSAGKPVFILGNDDVHDLNNANQVGRYCTWVNCDTISKKNILSAIKSGNAYGMIIGGRVRGKTDSVRSDLPKMKEIVLSGDTLTIAANEPAQDIRFMGQHGKMLAGFGNCSKASYVIKPTDTYVRTTVYYHDETQIFLNPIIRYNQSIDHFSSPEINSWKTMLFRLMGGLILAFYGLFIFRKLFRRKTISHSAYHEPLPEARK